MKIIPLADRVVIKIVEVEETTKGGLILTGSAKEKPQVAEVIAVGPGGVVDGKEVKMTVKVGDKVLTSKYPAPKSRWTVRSALSSVRAISWQMLRTEQYPLYFRNWTKERFDWRLVITQGEDARKGTVCRYRYPWQIPLRSPWDLA